MRLFLAIILSLTTSGCTQTENGLVFGMPDYEKRNIKVSSVDLDILVRVNEILSNEDSWEKGSVRVCGESNKLNLYCALEKASIQVMGKYVHRQPALQEVRFIIDDYYRERWEKHRLADFNSHPNTTFTDITSVIKRATETVQGKLRITKKSTRLPTSTGD